MGDDPDQWSAHPPNSAHVYHTKREGVARHWQEIDGLDVRPPVDGYDEGTMGWHRAHPDE